MRKRGHVTIFLSMLLVLVCAVLFTTIEAARMAASAVYFQMAVDSSVESCFGEYYRPLWDKYRILALYEDEALEDKVERYLEFYRDTDGTSFLRFGESEVSVEQVTYLMDQNAYYVQENGADYMKYQMAADATENLLEQFDLLDQIRSAAGIVKKIAGFTENILTIEAQVREIRDLTKDLAAALQEAGRVAATFQAELKEVPFPEEATEGGKIAQLLQLAEETVGELAAPLKSIEDSWPKLLDKVEAFKKTAEELADKLKEVLEEVDTGTYSGVIRQLLEEQLERVQSYSAAGGQRFQAVRDLQESLSAAREQIRQLEGLVEKLSEANVSEVQEMLRTWCMQVLGKVEIEVPEWMMSLGELQKDVEEMPEISLKVWTEEALLQVLIGEETEISAASLVGSACVSENVSGAELNDGSESGQLSAKLLFRAYLASEFSSFQEVLDGHFMKYELEYLLGGHKSDRENLLAVIGDLLVVREGVNFLEYLSDSAKCQEAAGLAAAVVGATGNPMLVQVLQTGILAVWALEDAVADVQQLMQGKQVPLLSLFGQEWVMLDYTGYLRVLLAFQGDEKLRLRSLDLIQATMQEEDEEFRIQHCVYRAVVEVQARSGSVFSQLPFVAELDGIRVSEGRYLVQSEFAYDS